MRDSLDGRKTRAYHEPPRPPNIREHQRLLAGRRKKQAFAIKRGTPPVLLLWSQQHMADVFYSCRFTRRGEKVGCCPREEDWTAVILDDDFARKLASTYKMTFPILRLYERDDTDTAISIFERSKDGEIKLHNFNLNGACQNHK